VNIFRMADGKCKSCSNGGGILKSDESCISNPKSEIANWTVEIARSNSIFRNFGFEMQDLSDFKISRSVKYVNALWFPSVRRGIS
jgi:hypothetical protein